MLFRGRRECDEVRALMSEYADGELAPPEQKRVDEHVGFCPRCRRILANLRRTLEGLGRLAGSTPRGAEDADSVAVRITRSWRERV
jgi:anti-sigma factor RsiW